MLKFRRVYTSESIVEMTVEQILGAIQNAESQKYTVGAPSCVVTVTGTR